MILALFCKAVFAAQVTVMGNMQTQRLYDSFALLKICYILLINICGIQLLCINQSLNLIQRLLCVRAVVGLRQQIQNPRFGICRNSHRLAQFAHYRL